MGTDPNLLMHLVNSPGLAGQAVFAGQNNALQQAEARQGLQFNALKMGALREQQVQKQQYQSDVETYLRDPTPNGILSLASRYPEQAEALRKGWDVKDSAQRTADMGQLGAIVSAIDSKRPDLALTQLRKRRDAEKARGIDVADLDHAIEGLVAGDEGAIKTLKGYALAHLSAADPERFAANYSAADKTGKDFTLGSGMRRYDSEGNLIAEAPFAPRPITVGEGDTVVEYQPGGGDQGSSGGGDLDTMVAITAQAESGNRERTANGSLVTSSAGAQGRMQVMPGTNTDPGYGVAPARDNSDAERSRVGRDYLAAMMKRYGNPKQAWAAYNAGPARVDEAIQSGGDKWLQRLPKETQSYVARNMVALGRASGGQSGARVIAQGAPKQGYQMLSPQEVASEGLDPNVKYQRSPTGQITPLGGQPKPPVLKPVPAPVVAKVLDNRKAVRNIDDALAELDKYPSGIGFVVGNLPNAVSQRTDQKGVALRSAIANIGSLMIHDRSGAAVTASETPRLLPFVPLTSDNEATARKKLKRLRAEITAINEEYELQYSEEQGYRPIAGSGSPASPAPVRVRSIQEAQRLKPGTIYIAPDGKKRRR